MLILVGVVLKDVEARFDWMLCVRGVFMAFIFGCSAYIRRLLFVF